MPSTSPQERASKPAEQPLEAQNQNPPDRSVGPVGLFIAASVAAVLIWLPFQQRQHASESSAERSERQRVDLEGRRNRPPRGFEGSLPSGPQVPSAGGRAFTVSSSSNSSVPSGTAAPAPALGSARVSEAGTGEPATRVTPDVNPGSNTDEAAAAEAEESALELIAHAQAEHRSAELMADQVEARAERERAADEDDADELEMRAAAAVRAARAAVDENPAVERLLEQALAAQDQAQARADNLRERGAQAERQGKARAQQIRAAADEMVRQANTEANRLRQSVRR